MAAVGATAVAGIFALTVLTHNHPIEITLFNPTQWAGDAAQNAGRTNVRILIEALADFEAQAPQSDMVRDIGHTHRTKVDGGEGSELLQSILGHHQSGLAIVVRSPGEILEAELE